MLRSEPESAEANYLLGDVPLARQDPDRAIPLLEKAVRLDPEEPHAQGALGRAYAILGRSADASFIAQVRERVRRTLACIVDFSLGSAWS